MSINVYWSSLEDEWMRAEEPFLVTKGLGNRLDVSETPLFSCPAFQESTKNLFALKSMYDYRFWINEKEIQSDMYDQKFLEDRVLVRSLKEKMLSFGQYYSFFTEEKSLLITGNIPPFFEENAISERCIMFPGTFDIGKYYRNLEFGFKIKTNFNHFEINRGDIYQYVQFHTKKKINFIQYRQSSLLNEFMKETISSRSFKTKYSSLEEFYSFFKIKKMVLKEIKKNIVG